jgi:outer membrane receptor protein involved in Fe transport
MRRNYANGYPLVNPGQINATEVLPSVNIVYKLRYDESAPVNIRLNYSRSIARPGIRELSDVANYDNDLRKFVFGNSELKSVHIDNYDFRLEYYSKSGDNYSVSVFDKEFRNHIELVESSGFSWQNVDKSRVTGIELEAKKRLGSRIDLAANVTLVRSNTKFVRDRREVSGSGVWVHNYLDTVSRAMLGQSPYVLNAIVTYHLDSIGLGFTAAYNIQGERLVIAGADKSIPDVYEQPRHIVDLKVFKKFGKHFTINVGCRDILNTTVERSYKYPDGSRVTYDKYKWGANYTFGLLYKL